MSDNRPLSQAEREIVKTLVDTKAVNFDALGSALAKFGPTAALNLEGEDFFCGTMRRFVHVFRVRDPGVNVMDIEGLRGVSGELGGG